MGFRRAGYAPDPALACAVVTLRRPRRADGTGCRAIRRVNRTAATPLSASRPPRRQQSFATTYLITNTPRLYSRAVYDAVTHRLVTGLPLLRRVADGKAEVK